MKPAIGTAPAKIILFGEHAVVYGRPAIAVPITKVSATVKVSAGTINNLKGVFIQAPDIHMEADLASLPPEHPIGVAIQGFLSSINSASLPDCTIHISSTIPVASGMGSGAAVTVALLRALDAFMDQNLPNEVISTLTFEVEKIHHGTPSGIDNTVITYEKPVYFIRGETPQTFSVAKPFSIVIGDTGIASSTAVTVGDVRKAWQANTQRYEKLFDKIGDLTQKAKTAIENGYNDLLGGLMNENHTLLQALDVSSAELEHLVNAARQAGAAGAKLSGGGRGGNMIALVETSQIESVTKALMAAGARHVIVSEIR